MSVCILFLTNKYSVLHIQYAAAKIAFLACCLDILTEATYFLYNTRHCLFVILFGLRSLSALPVASHSFLNIMLLPKCRLDTIAHHLIVIFSNKFNAFPCWGESLYKHAQR